MMADLTLPAGAERVVAAIRENAPRPPFPPTGTLRGLRWYFASNTSVRVGYCPLGLLSDATIECPNDADDAGLKDDDISDEEVEAFWRWWDALDEGQAAEAMDLIWGPTT